MSLAPEPIASGRDADVFALDDHRVLRRYRSGGDVTAEAEVMRYVADLGYPVPAVYEARGAELVLERLAGPSLGRALLDGDVGLASGARILADLHDRLHALPARRGADPADRVLHLDLHPDNVMLSRRGPVLIDWRNADEGPPGLDVALSALILAQLAVDPDDGRSGAARDLMAEFLRRVGGDPAAHLDRAVARRGADSNMSRAEVSRLGAAAALVRRAA